MLKQTTINVSPQQASDAQYYIPILSKKLNIKQNQIKHHKIVKRSIDARNKTPKIQLKIDVYINETPSPEKPFIPPYKKISSDKQVIIAGAGPAGLFAAIKLIEHNIKPIILERGKEIAERKKDISKINRNISLDPNSNYCYGEGGAGTFSDGKLYTRSSKRGNVQRILKILEYHGASKNIIADAHPHIGTNILPKIIIDIREHIIKSGGEIHFNEQITDIEVSQDEVTSVTTNNQNQFKGDALILATGHSARDIYELLNSKNLALEEKGFAMGVRVEHQQKLIDSIQYHCKVRDQYLPAATYNLVQQVEGRGVYSFCMCPGGYIIPASCNDNEIVVNGMSPSTRNSPFANSGMVVEIRPEDFPNRDKYGVLAGLKYQEKVERDAFLNGGKGLEAPAQRLTDFIKGRLSSSLPETSYRPGVVSSPMHFWLPDEIAHRLQKGLKLFNNKMRNFVNEDAICLGVESRTSSPIRIPRDKIARNHVQIKNLYPCGEGAGYAGGIVSSAIDGENSAEVLAMKLNNAN